MLRKGSIVVEFTGLLRYIDKALCFLLQRFFHLFMAAVRKRVKFLAGVTGIDRVVGTVCVDRKGTGTNVTDVLHVDNATDLPFSRHLMTMYDFSSQKTAHDALIDRTLAQCFLFDAGNIRSRRNIGTRRNCTVVA